MGSTTTIPIWLVVKDDEYLLRVKKHKDVCVAQRRATSSELKLLNLIEVFPPRLRGRCNSGLCAVKRTRSKRRPPLWGQHLLRPHNGCAKAVKQSVPSPVSNLHETTFGQN